MDTGRASYRTLFGTSWGLCVAGMIIAIPVIWMRVHDTEVTAEDFVHAGETAELDSAAQPAAELAPMEVPVSEKEGHVTMERAA
jgi:hypothetical protein